MQKMSDSMRAIRTAATRAAEATGGDEDNSLTVVLTICALGLLLSTIAAAITPNWFFALAM